MLGRKHIFSGKTPRKAYDRYARTLGDILRCVTNAHIISNTHPQLGEEFLFSFSSNPAQLSGSEYDFFLIQRAKIIPDERNNEWKVTTLSYEYAIVRRHDKQEVVAFHWEGKEGRNPVPHMHIGFAMDGQLPLLGPKAHIPSGRVLIEDIVSFVISELDVSPRVNDWKNVVSKTRVAVMKWKTW